MNNFEFKKSYGFEDETYIIIPTEVFVRYANHPLVKRLYLTDIGFFPHAEHHYVERKDGVPEYIFLYCTEGKGTVIVENEVFSMSENKAICIPGGKRHVYYSDSDNPWSIFWVHFKGDDTVNYPIDKPEIITFESEFATNRISFIFSLLFRVLNANYTLGNFIYMSQVVQMLLSETYYREKNTLSAGEENRHLTEITKYMCKNIGRELMLDDLSSFSGLSISYINHIFKVHTDRSPMDFFTTLKMKQACTLLRSTDSYIYEIALKLGYQDQYYFSRVFRKNIGVSPKEYRSSDYFQSKNNKNLSSAE